MGDHGLLDWGAKLSAVGWFLALACTIITILTSGRQMGRYFTAPDSRLQHLYCRLFFFCPLVACLTFLSVSIVETTEYIHLLINVYEGLVLLWILNWLHDTLGHSEIEIQKSLEREDDKYLHLALPFLILLYPIRSCLFTKTKLNSSWMKWFKIACWQCLILRPILTLLVIIKDEESPVLSFLKVLSLIIAVKCVMGAYYGAMSVVGHLNPLGKFTVVKLALLVTVIIPSILADAGKSAFDSDDHFEDKEKARMVGSFIVNILVPFMVLGFYRHFPVLELEDQSYFFPLVDKRSVSNASV
eukprot:TRINITY_DN12400_c0_g1::TRINITY_DN12400_c0_g1_i1::g.4925::m.4925 TRINITY_DN12400_c0_g1::TRINITY_DN12400_c0_g1_i1::g.4925  ORF type:complete len:311 (+),score=65.28,Solute_trans_a/PF03619.11/3.9e-16 TRINITY_DN12400_c0_g1_i1:34-933(+)